MGKNPSRSEKKKGGRDLCEWIMGGDIHRLWIVFYTIPRRKEILLNTKRARRKPVFFPLKAKKSSLPGKCVGRCCLFLSSFLFSNSCMSMWNTHSYMTNRRKSKMFFFFLIILVTTVVAQTKPTRKKGWSRWW